MNGCAVMGSQQVGNLCLSNLCLVSLCVAGLSLGLVTPAAAQSARIQPEIRADGIFGSANTYHATAGASTPLGNYIRVSLVAGGGVTVANSESRASGRVDLVGRFLIDPYRQQRWGPYGGAGVSVRGERGATGRAYLVAMLGIEGPPGPLFVPALELGLGGGTRVGLVLRRSLTDRR